MSDLCLLVASLVAHGQVPGWQLANPISKVSELFPSVVNAGLSRWCGPSTTIATVNNLGPTALVSMAEVDRPEFSSTAPQELSPVAMSVSTMLPPSARPIAVPLQEPSLPEPRFDDPAVSHQPSNRFQTTSGVAPRPVSGAQLYQQRLAALASGKTYTRLPADSFHEQWSSAREQPTHNQWIDLLKQEASAMARGQGNARLTVLLGDSLSLWFPSELMTTDRFWLNQGISGDTTAGILQRLAAFNDTRPDTIYVMAGINDLRRGATDTEVTNNLRSIMRQLKQSHPQAKIIVHSILPTRLATLPTQRIRRLNAAIAVATQEEGVSFLNLQHDFMDEVGILRRDLTTDGLHLNDRGYRTWGNVMVSVL